MGIPIQAVLQQYTIANVAQSLYQTDLDTLGTGSSRLHQLQMAVKMQIFNPIFMNFPILDKLPIPSRKLARQAVDEFSQELQIKIRGSHQHEGNKCDANSKDLGCRLLAAHADGELTARQLRDNLNVTFVAGQENPQLALISTLYLLGKHIDVQNRLRRAMSALDLRISSLEDIPFLTAVIYESLRMFPPIGQLINRRVSHPTFLGNRDIFIPEGTYVGYNCYATNRDPKVWSHCDRFMPERWGTTNEEIAKQYRRAKAKASFITFHGGKRACLGEKFALLQLRATLFVLLRQLKWQLDPTWPERMTPVRSILYLVI